MIELKNVSKFYSKNNVTSLGLKNINLKLNTNEIVAITGESGSGKSTLLNVITKMDTFDEGEIVIDGEETSYFSINDMDKFRKNKVGFIFQNYNIIESYTVLRNVMLPFEINGLSKKEAREKAIELIKKVGLEKRMHNRGSKLSGGEKQRTVIARALASKCEILACDEPTGNLDSKTGKEIVELLKEVAKDKLVLIVTHNYEEIKDIATRRLILRDGEIVNDEIIKEIPDDNKVYDECEYSSVSRKKCLSIGTTNLIYTPRKTIFISIVIALLCSIILIIGSTIIMNANNISSNPRFYSADNNSIYVVGNENKKIDNDLLHNYRNYEVNPFEIVEPKSCIGLLYNDSHDYIIYNDNYNHKLVKGRMPENDNEICINYIGFNDEILDSYIGKKIVIDFEIYTVCGIAKNLSTSANYAIAFGNTKLKKQLKTSGMYAYTSRSHDTGCYYTFDMLFDEKKESDKDVSIHLTKEHYNYQLNTKLDTEKIDFKNDLTLRAYYYDSPMNLSGFDYEIVEDERDYIVIRNDDVIPMVSVLVYDVSASSEAHKLNNMGYYAYDTSYVIKRPMDYFEDIDIYMSIIAFSLMLIGLYLLTYSILKLIFRTKKYDYNIMRTLGMDSRSISRVTVYEMSIITFIISNLVYIIFKIISFNVSNEVFSEIYIFGFKEYIIYFIFVFILGVLLARRFNRKLFKFSVNNSFESRGK